MQYITARHLRPAASHYSLQQLLFQHICTFHLKNLHRSCGSVWSLPPGPEQSPPSAHYFPRGFEKEWDLPSSRADGAVSYCLTAWGLCVLWLQGLCVSVEREWKKEKKKKSSQLFIHLLRLKSAMLVSQEWESWSQVQATSSKEKHVVEKPAALVPHTRSSVLEEKRKYLWK